VTSDDPVIPEANPDDFVIEPALRVGELDLDLDQHRRPAIDGGLGIVGDRSGELERGCAVSNSLGSETFDGGFIGGGTEIAVQAWPGLFWRSEYRYSSYRSKDVQATYEGIAYPTFVEHENKNVQTITTSLVWKFNWGH
jgi:opacity protein-like surface antigen